MHLALKEGNERFFKLLMVWGRGQVPRLLWAWITSLLLVFNTILSDCSKWAYLSINFAPLPRYDAIGHLMHVFDNLCKKIPKNDDLNDNTYLKEGFIVYALSKLLTKYKFLSLISICRCGRYLRMVFYTVMNSEL